MIDKTDTPAPALVTGAADRIGAAMARRLAKAGHPVIVHYKDSGDRAQDLCRAIIDGGGKARPVRADLADRDERATLIARSVECFGPLGVLVNNASLFEPDSVETLDEELWDMHFRVHTEAPLFLARDFAKQLPDDTHGSIVNIIDKSVLDLSPAYTSYTLSKSALWTATRTMAQNLAPRIRVNAVGPGPTLPEAGQSQASFDKRIADLPLGTGPTPDDICDALMYLLTANVVTGQMIVVDGGAHLEWPERAVPTPRRK